MNEQTDLSLDELRPGMVAVLGVPFDANSSYLPGAVEAPLRIREALHCSAANLATEDGRDLGAVAEWRDMGDLDLTDLETARQQIEASAAAILASGASLVSLGGDHSITYPLVRAFAAAYPGLNILQLDAHPDLYDELDGNRYSHACPFARIMEENLAGRLVQMGVRAMTPLQRRQADRFGVEVIPMSVSDRLMPIEFQGPLYLSLDLDCLDPGCAPGVSHHEPGGFMTREVLDIIHNLRGNLVGADIVELNPRRDLNNMTATLAAKLLKEIVARLLGGGDSSTPEV
ncbi:MAG: agmatinase [bacterium]